MRRLRGDGSRRILGDQVHPVPQRGHQHDVGGEVERGDLFPGVGLVQVPNRRLGQGGLFIVNPADQGFHFLQQLLDCSTLSCLGLATCTNTACCGPRSPLSKREP